MPQGMPPGKPRPFALDYDKNKVDDMVLALLWLTTFGEE
jgi:hypothetical protein